MKMSDENCNPFGKCEEQRGKIKVIVCAEKSKKYEYINGSKHFIVKIRVDGCLIKTETERKCDFMILNCNEPKKAYLIELKGHDLNHAASQILNVINLFQRELLAYEIHARIVLSRAFQGDIQSENYVKLQRKIKNIDRIKHRSIEFSEKF